MEALQIFGLWDQEIYLWFRNHEPLIPTPFKISKINLHVIYRMNALKNQKSWKKLPML